MDFQQEGYSEDNDNNETNTSKKDPLVQEYFYR